MFFGLVVVSISRTQLFGLLLLIQLQKHLAIPFDLGCLAPLSSLLAVLLTCSAVAFRTAVRTDRVAPFLVCKSL